MRVLAAALALAYVLTPSGAAAPSQLSGTQLLPKTHAIYQTKPMNTANRGEDKQIIEHGVLIHYMSANEREEARVVIVQGTLYTSRGKPVPYGSGQEKLNYAMDAAGNFYIFDQTGHPELRHSSFFAGGPVACAGMLEVKDGKVVKIDSSSGHYNPSPGMFQNVLTELKKDGVTIPRTENRAASPAPGG